MTAKSVFDLRPSTRRRNLAAYARRLRRNSFCAETVEDEIKVEDLCDSVLSDIRYADQRELIELASTLAYTEGLLYAW